MYVKFLETHQPPKPLWLYFRDHKFTKLCSSNSKRMLNPLMIPLESLTFLHWVSWDLSNSQLLYKSYLRYFAKLSSSNAQLTLDLRWNSFKTPQSYILSTFTFKKLHNHYGNFSTMTPPKLIYSFLKKWKQPKSYISPLKVLWIMFSSQ